MNMYVSNLSFHTDGEALKTLFSQFGSVKFCQSYLRQGNRKEPRIWLCGDGRGIRRAGRNERLAQQEIEGRALSVTIAKEKTPRSRQ
jgi:RNA recognition motif-containing protein